MVEKSTKVKAVEYETLYLSRLATRPSQIKV